MAELQLLVFTAAILSVILESDLCQTLIDYVRCYSAPFKKNDISNRFPCVLKRGIHTHRDTQTHRHTDTHIHTHTYTQTHTHTHTHTRTHTHTHTHTHTKIA